MAVRGTTRWPGLAAIRFAVTAAFWLMALTIGARPALAQSGYYVEASGDYSPVDIGTASQEWKSARLSGGWYEEGRSGWSLGMERLQREQLVDWTGSASGFRRTGDWTFSGGLGLGVNPAFTYQRSYEGGLARTIVGSLVAEGGYRYLGFAQTTVHLIQPGATLYLPHGDVGARYFIVRNATRGTTTRTLLVRGTLTVHPRLRFGGGGAYGERIFDIASLSSPSAESWVGYGFAHVTVSHAWGIDVGVGRAHEDPFFSQRTLTLGVRHTFGGQP